MAGPPSLLRGDSSKDHRPANPSSLRHSHSPSSRPSSSETDADADADADANLEPEPSPSIAAGDPSELSPLIQIHHVRDAVSMSGPRKTHPAHAGICNHGTFSPRPSSPTGSHSGSGPGGGIFSQSFDGSTVYESHLDTTTTTTSRSEGLDGEDSSSWTRRVLGALRTKKMGHTSELAEQAGFRDTPFMYLAYYVPCLTWIRRYKLSYLQGDLVAAITMSSVYLPMVLSLATNLAHVPPINGLYGFVVSPFIYAIFGSCPQMVIGPEAAGSLMVGTVVKSVIDTDGGNPEENDLLHAQICGVTTGIAGAMVLIAGLARLGFLDSVLSRPFLRGFISAIGFVIAVDQLVPELGLDKIAAQEGASHGSSVDKIIFIAEHLEDTHRLTFAIAGASFLTIMVFRELKKRLDKRYPAVVFIPDRLGVVVISAILCWQLGWEHKGVGILGAVKPASEGLLKFRWPLQLAHMKHIRAAMSTGFLIALLGFFESSVAAKSLGRSSIPGIELSANREMIALGLANVIGGSFMSLPAFGGYGRSKVNKTTGAKTPMSSVFLSAISLLAILHLLPYFYYIPKAVLSAMISVVAWSLIEEAPHDIRFFLRVRGWTELFLMATIVLFTIFYSLTLGMALGVGISLLMVIKHSTRPRIQILGRVPGTTRFENAESSSQIEFIEGCLIVKIPEPLTFANTGELRGRLRRLEYYGTANAHPALPRIRSQESNRNIIFDIHGMMSIDGSGVQVLEEIVRDYRERGVRVIFSRVPANRGHPVWVLMERSGIIELCGGEGHFVDGVEEALRLTEDYDDSIVSAQLTRF